MKYYSNYSENKLSKETYDPLEDEEKILEFWTKQKTTEKIREKRHQENNGVLTIFNGPVFPTGSPHSGHVVNLVMKDIFTRYAHQKNLDVVSRFGWDCHGLPVEHEVDKKLEIQEPKDFDRIGISKYNEECRKFVQRHASDWENNLLRIGIGIDLKSAYWTMNEEIMDGMWGVFKQIFDQELVYKDTKVLPYSTGCFTHLSNFEAELNWKESTGVAVIVALKIVESDIRLLIWTESPWKIPTNFAVCVNPTARYMKVQMVANGLIYIVSEKRLASVFPNSNDFSVLEEIQGKHIGNLNYQPLFDFLPGSHKILQDDSISDELGTGIVALCPHFNQNEYRICIENGLCVEDVPCPIDNCGRFTRSIIEMGGLSIEEASLFVIQDLEKRGHLVHLQNVDRKRQHCWRSDVPLIDKIATSWFIKVDKLKEKLRENNAQITWVPKLYKEEMDDNFEKLSDWPIGRDRHWGTPIPIWSSPSGDEIFCISCAKELMELTGLTEIPDLHKEFIDKLQIPSRVPGNPPLRRISEVFDCWFESGTLPILQQTKEQEIELFVEGEDQMNGWFLATSILSAALCLPAPAKTIVVHGLVEGSDGMKLSKRKHNHNDAIKIAEKYGADALRLYLVTTPLVAGKSFSLQENEVREFKKKVFQSLYKILYDVMPSFGKQGWVSYGIAIETTHYENIFERWILSRTEDLVQFYENELKAHRLHLVIPRVIELLELYYKWFVPAMKITGGKLDKTFVVFNVIYKICLVLAPFAPFFTEHIYQIFKPWTILYDKFFVHNLPLTEKSDKLIQYGIDLKVSRWKTVVEMVLEARKKHTIAIGYRIIELVVVHPLENYLDETEALNDALVALGNVHHVIRTTDCAQFGITLKAELKPRASLEQNISQDDWEKINSKVERFGIVEVGELIRVGSEEIDGHFITFDDLKISHVFENVVLDENTAIVCRDDVAVVIKMNKHLGYYEEGTRIEVLNAVQKLRKKAKVFSSECVTVCYLTEDACMENAFEKFSREVKNTKIVSINEFCDEHEEAYLQETVNVKATPVILYLFKEKEEQT